MNNLFQKATLCSNVVIFLFYVFAVPLCILIVEDKFCMTVSTNKCGFSEAWIWLTREYEK